MALVKDARRKKRDRAYVALTEEIIVSAYEDKVAAVKALVSESNNLEFLPLFDEEFGPLI